MTAKLPIAFEAAIESAATLGVESQRLVRVALDRLWLDAAKPLPDGFTFLSTGDIPAMWIRDSTWQVRPLLRFASDPSVAGFVESIIRTQAFYLGIDPYANAFNPAPDGNCWHRDFPDQSPWVFERKFELDSITGFWQLSLDYDERAWGTGLLDSDWWGLTESLVELLSRETQHEPDSYLLHRPNNPPHDSLSNGGRGADYQNCGLIWSAFRPSDDACELPFHIPSNIHAAVMLRRIALKAGLERKALAESCVRLAQQIDAAVAKHGWVDANGERVLAYEVDGMGGAVLMDDANYPNLLSLPFLGYTDSAAVAASRRFSLSASNPWFFTGDSAEGLGSPHTGRGMVWPLAIAMVGITAAGTDEKLRALRMIESNLAGGAIHESFEVDAAQNFTRDWFNWAEMTYLELAMEIVESLSVNLRDDRSLA